MELLPLDKPEFIRLAAQWLGREENYKWLDFGDGAQALSGSAWSLAPADNLGTGLVLVPPGSTALDDGLLP